MTRIHGSCQRPCPATSLSASLGPHEPGAYECTGGGSSSSGCMIRHVSSTPSWRVNRVLSPTIAACSSTSYGVAPSPPSSANSMSSSIGAGPARSARCASSDEPDPGRRVELDHELVLLGAVARDPEAEPGRLLEDEPKLGLGRGQPLARADEERDAGPAPVLDLEAQRGVRLGRRVGGDPVDVEVAVVLPADVVGGVGLRDGVEERDLRVLERLGSPREGASIALAATTCMRWFTTTSRSAPTGS